MIYYIKFDNVSQEKPILPYTITNITNDYILLDDIKLSFKDDVTYIVARGNPESKVKTYILTNAYIDGMTDEEYMFYKDRCDSLIYSQYHPDILIIKHEEDIYIYSIVHNLDLEGIEHTVIENTTRKKLNDFLKEHTELPIELHEKFKKFYNYHYAVKKFYTSLYTFSTPVNSYFDLEIDFLMNYIKYLYEQKDEKLLSFLEKNEKYKLIFNTALSENRDTIENKTISSIENAFVKKKYIQDKLLEFYNDAEIMKNDTSDNYDIHDIKNIVYA